MTKICFRRRAARYNGKSRGPNLSRCMERLIAGWSGDKTCPPRSNIAASDCALVLRRRPSLCFEGPVVSCASWPCSSASSMRCASQYESSASVAPPPSTIVLSCNSARLSQRKKPAHSNAYVPCQLAQRRSMKPTPAQPAIRQGHQDAHGRKVSITVRLARWPADEGADAGMFTVDKVTATSM